MTGAREEAKRQRWSPDNILGPESVMCVAVNMGWIFYLPSTSSTAPGSPEASGDAFGGELLNVPGGRAPM